MATTNNHLSIPSIAIPARRGLFGNPIISNSALSILNSTFLLGLLGFNQLPTMEQSDIPILFIGIDYRLIAPSTTVEKVRQINLSLYQTKPIYRKTKNELKPIFSKEL